MLGSKRSAMAQRSSTCTLTRAADAPSDGHIHLVAPALALGMAAIGFVASDKPSLRTTTVSEWMGSLPSAADTDSRVPDRDGASRANDDGYLEGLQKALGY